MEIWQQKALKTKNKLNINFFDLLVQAEKVEQSLNRYDPQVSMFRLTRWLCHGNVFVLIFLWYSMWGHYNYSVHRRYNFMLPGQALLASAQFMLLPFLDVYESVMCFNDALSLSKQLCCQQKSVANFIEKNLIFYMYSNIHQKISKILRIPKLCLFFLQPQRLLNFQQFCDFSQNKICKTYLATALPPGGKNWQLISPHYFQKWKKYQASSISCPCPILFSKLS